MTHEAPPHVTVTVVIEEAELEEATGDADKATALRAHLGEQVYAEALRKLPPHEKPDWVSGA